MRKRKNIGLILAIALGGLYFWQRARVARAKQAALAAPATVGQQVSQAITGS